MGEDKVMVYGLVKFYKSVCDEYYGKFIWVLIDDILLNVSQCIFDCSIRGFLIGEFEIDDVLVGSDSKFRIIFVDGFWLLGDVFSLIFKYVKYLEDSSFRFDVLLGFIFVLGDFLDVNNID